MPLSNTSMRFVYPEYVPATQFDKVGGFATSSTLRSANVLGETQLFPLAVLHGASYVQYRKVFIRNVGDATAVNVLLYGYNKNANSIVTMALEKGQNKQTIYDGQESIKDGTVEPSLYDAYTFAEIAEVDAVSIGNIAIGKCVGIWLKQYFTTIDAFSQADEFIMGIKFEEGSLGVQYTKEATIGHSRISGTIPIIEVAPESTAFRSYTVEFDWVDTTAYGIPINEAFYAIYIDRMFKCEHAGSGRTTIQLYSSNIPITIEVFLLPYSGYRPVLSAIPAGDKNRIKLIWYGRNPEIFDVVEHVVYWDDRTGAYLTKPMARVNALVGNGGGIKVELLSLTR